MANKPSTILIVDDDKTVIEQLLAHFRRRNYEPIATANPTIVEQTLQNFRVDLILLDLRMERLNGYEVLKKLREQKISTPVLIITAYFKDEKEKLRTIGITDQDVIQKPFQDFSKIEAVINRKLNKVEVLGEVGSDYENEIYYDNKTKIVLVEDETELNEILKEILEERKYLVSIFTKGDQALEYILNNECHVLIVDMKLPGLGGEQLIQEALQKKPFLKILPISASYGPEVQQLLAKVGFDPKTLVSKPFDLPTLVEKVKVLATEAGTLGASSR